MSEPEAQTLTVYIERWLRRRRVRGRPLAPGTVARYRLQLRVDVLPVLGHLPIAELTRPHVRAWYDALVDNGQPITAAQCYQMLWAMLATAVEDELPAETPCTLRGAADVFSPARPVLSVEQVLAVAEQVGPAYRAVVLTGASAACGSGSWRPCADRSSTWTPRRCGSWPAPDGSTATAG